MANLLEKVLMPFIDFIYPPTCISCEQRLLGSQRHVCTSCWNSLERVRVTDDFQLMHKRMFDEGKSVTKFLSCFYFEEEGPIQKIVHGLKYQNRRSLGIELGKVLGESVSLNQDFRPAAILIAVPLHRIKFRERGYNQCDFIARGVAEVTGQTIRTDLLFRRKNTASQTALSLKDRKENVSDAFVVVNGLEDQVRRASILLIDDLITTGATITACAQALRSAGAVNVLAASVALAK